MRPTEAPELSPDEREMARVAQRCIMAELDHSRAAAILLTTEDGSQPSVELPPGALRFIGELLGLMAQGQAVSIIPYGAELSTVEAAGILNVSRPHLIALLEREQIPYRMVGSHRRIRFSDLAEYKERSREARHLALERLGKIDRELGLDP